MKIFLIGLPGCGKSTLGKEIAQALKKTFVDLDAAMVKGEKKSIAEIFAKEGENYFRGIERKYLLSFCEGPSGFVMATGGGTPCFFDNIQVINKSGISIFLDTSTREITTRMMKTELAKRPLFAGQDESTITGRVEAMRLQRIHFYKQAHLTFSGEDINCQAIIREIEKLKG